jgi:RNA polymerase sigma-70 factor (ECF subfamily)
MDTLESQLLKYNDRLLSFVRSKISDPELAIDVLQESFYKAIRTIGNLKDEDKILSWFYRILHGTIIDLYRRRGIEKKALKQLSVELESSFAPEDEEKICNCIQWLIPTLKPEFAEIITLDLKEVDSGDIADQLGITKDNIKVRRHRAREQLKKRLEETCNICAKHGCFDCDCKRSE